VDGDGNCLAHAVSRCSYQSELYWHAIRSELHQELTEYRQFYIDQFAEVFGTVTTRDSERDADLVLVQATQSVLS
jgi:hypothetical protein